VLTDTHVDSRSAVQRSAACGHPATAHTEGRLCRSCGARLHQSFVNLGMSPLANSYLRADQINQMEPFYPLQVYVCAECLLVQLESFKSPDQIFGEYAYFSSYSDTWVRHAAAYVEMATRRFGLSRESQVLEVASNDGYLLQHFVRRGVPALGIEPAANVAAVAVAKGIPTRVQFFGREAAAEIAGDGVQADLVIGNNVLAHTPHLNDFVQGLKLVLKPRGVITMEFPHLLRLMAENQFDTIYHEHFSYFSLIAVSRVFEQQGLTIFDVDELPTHGGSLRIYARHAQDSSRALTTRVADLLERETAAGLSHLEAYLAFGGQVRRIKARLLKFLIAAKTRNKSIAGYGAPAKGNTLLNYCGIGSDFIDYTVDRSPHKQGLYLPGTHIPILSPDRVRETRPDYLLILPWNLRNEIIPQMAHIREWGGQFVTPIPDVRIWS
jgi:SAM-dependent methyltransferase